MFYMVLPVFCTARMKNRRIMTFFRAECTILILLDVAKLIINKQRRNFIGLKL